MVPMGMPGLRGGRKPRLQNTFSEQGNSVTIGFLVTAAADLSSGLRDTVKSQTEAQVRRSCLSIIIRHGTPFAVTPKQQRAHRD